MITCVDRSITGADEVHLKFSGICEGCITPAEQAEIFDAIAAAIIGRRARI